VGGVVIA
nr:Chain P, Heptapeptide from Amyloid beta A4 protein [Homo sapiens]